MLLLVARYTIKLEITLNMLNKKYNWDYNLKKNWKPKTDRQWLWYLERKINYDDYKGLERKMIKKYFFQLEKRLDPGKRAMFKYYFWKK
ncbi:MAG: Uncharacterized protein CEN87_88 [Parcubacteria group bacterium Licking1014_1]|nr:MAG: Uncharacterized protein CEN87_88 [Parcubacteria group bacterium Licking1014_1]